MWLQDALAESHKECETLGLPETLKFHAGWQRWRLDIGGQSHTFVSKEDALEAHRVVTNARQGFNTKTVKDLNVILTNAGVKAERTKPKAIEAVVRHSFRTSGIPCHCCSAKVPHLVAFGFGGALSCRAFLLARKGAEFFPRWTICKTCSFLPFDAGAGWPSLQSKLRARFPGKCKACRKEAKRKGRQGVGFCSEHSVFSVFLMFFPMIVWNILESILDQISLRILIWSCMVSVLDISLLFAFLEGLHMYGH